MDLKQLEAMGAFKDRSLVTRTITVRRFPILPEGEWDEPGIPKFAQEEVEDTFDIFIKKRSSADSIELSRADPRLLCHYDVFRCVVDEKGEQIFPTIEHVLALEEWMLIPLFNKVFEVNPRGPKSSPPRTKPGASSRSGSGGVPSRNGRKLSRKKSGRSGARTGASTER